MTVSDFMWVEATRDIEAEERIIGDARARHATADMWNFTRVAKTQPEFEQRFALVQEDAIRLTSNAFVSAMREELLREGAARWGQGQARTAILLQTPMGWIKVTAAADPTPSNPAYPSSEQEHGPMTGNTGDFPQSEQDPWNPMNGDLPLPPNTEVPPTNRFPMEPTPWTPRQDASWVERPMNLQQQAVITEPVEQNPHYFDPSVHGISSDPRDGFPQDPEDGVEPQDPLQRYENMSPNVTASFHRQADDPNAGSGTDSSAGSSPGTGAGMDAGIAPPPPSMTQGGPGAEASPSPQAPPTSNTPQNPSSPGPTPGSSVTPPSAPDTNRIMGAIDPRVAQFFRSADVRNRPTEQNPSGIADEYDDRNWDGPANQHPRQNADQRNVNTPQTAGSPVPTMSSTDMQGQKEEQ